MKGSGIGGVELSVSITSELNDYYSPLINMVTYNISSRSYFITMLSKI
jgi:hypothetical protein